MSDTHNQVSDSQEGTGYEGKATPHTTGFSVPVSFLGGWGVGVRPPLPIQSQNEPTSSITIKGLTEQGGQPYGFQFFSLGMI